MNITDALRSLDSLDEDLFDINIDEISDAFDLYDEDPDEEVIIVDPEAKDYDDIQDSYEGKIILDCEVCHSLIYKDKDDIDIDTDDSDVVNKEDQCPYCFSEEGFKIVGKIVPFKSIEDFETQEFDNTDEDEEDHGDEEDHDDEEESDVDETPIDSEELNEDYNDIIDEIERELSDDVNMNLESLHEDAEGEPEEVTKDPDINTADGAIDFLIADEQEAIDGYSDVMTKLGDYGLTEKEVAGWESVLNFIIEEEQKHIDYLENMRNGIFDIDENHAEDDEDDQEEEDEAEEADAAEEEVDETLTEDFNKVCIETDESKLSMLADPDGTVTVVNQPLGNDSDVEEIEEVDIEDTEDVVLDNKDVEEEETMVPVEVADLEDTDEDEDMEDVEIEEMNDSTFDEVIESYLHECYRNVKSFKSLNAMNSDDKIIVEGLITFKSGKTKHCDFSLTPKTVDKRNNVVLEGYCPTITDAKDSFELKGKIVRKSLITESLNYDYNDNDVHVKGTVRRAHKN